MPQPQMPKKLKLNGSYEDLQDLLELTSKIAVLFHRWILEFKCKNSRDTWSNRQVWPWSTKWCRVKANRVSSRECSNHNKHLLPTTQETALYLDITRWSILKLDWLYYLQLKMEKLYTVSKNEYLELTVTQNMNSLLQVSDLIWRK